MKEAVKILAPLILHVVDLKYFLKFWQETGTNVNISLSYKILRWSKEDGTNSWKQASNTWNLFKE